MLQFIDISRRQRMTCRTTDERQAADDRRAFRASSRISPVGGELIDQASETADFGCGGGAPVNRTRLGSGGGGRAGRRVADRLADDLGP